MSTREPHCPFLNRSDARCGTHFNLETLSSAFDDCFGCYASCATYQELLGERRERREQVGQSFAAYPMPPQVIRVRVPAGHHTQAA
jgi:hypothetical protein